MSAAVASNIFSNYVKKASTTVQCSASTFLGHGTDLAIHFDSTIKEIQPKVKYAGVSWAVGIGASLGILAAVSYFVGFCCCWRASRNSMPVGTIAGTIASGLLVAGLAMLFGATFMWLYSTSKPENISPDNVTSKCYMVIALLSQNFNLYEPIVVKRTGLAILITGILMTVIGGGICAIGAISSSVNKEKSPTKGVFALAEEGL